MASIRSIALCVAASTLLLSCGRETGPGLEIHDTKYVALGADGSELAEPPERWECVLDRYTGLTWEVKSDQPGLHDWRNTYSWFNPGESSDGELDYRGTRDAGHCAGSACDTDAFVTAVNEAGYCGYRDWRLASRDELASISDLRKTESPPTINTRYFPYAQAGEYWSSNDYQFQYNAAWLWNFQFGHDRVEWKASPRFARLVRGEALHLERVKDGPMQ
jgi:hypothetical protein